MYSVKTYVIPLNRASVDGLLDLVKRTAEVTAKDCLKGVFVPDPLLPPSVRYDVGLTVVGTKWQSDGTR